MIKKPNTDKTYIASDTPLLTDPLNVSQQNLLLEHMLELSEEFLQFDDKELDYQKIVDGFLSLCSAKYAVFNLFNPDGITFSTKAVAGDKGLVQKISTLLGYNIIDRQWPFDPVYFSKISANPMTRFDNLNEIIGNSLPKTIVPILSSLLNLGEIIVLKIMRRQQILGEFTIFMAKNKVFELGDIAQIYTKQVGLLLTRFDFKKKLYAQRNLLETTLLSIGDGVITTDIDGKITLFNKVAEQLTGFKQAAAIGMKIETVFNIIDEITAKPQENIVTNVINSSEIMTGNARTRLVSRDASKRPIELKASPIIDQKDGLIGVVLVFRDYTDKQKKEDEIRHLSFHDQLTGLYNRRYYLEELKRLDQPSNLPIAIIMGDVNGLKVINDSFGHTQGDLLLTKAANLIKAGCRSKDVIARLGGDEFVIILPSTSKEQVEATIGRLKSLSTETIIMTTPISISFGYGIKTQASQDLTEVQKIAEDHMYKHKLYDTSSVRNNTIQLIMNTLYEKSERERAHTQRVSDLCERIAIELGYDEDHRHLVRTAGLMHDIGKIGVDERILNKEGDLTDIEWAQVQRHSEIGYRILISSKEFTDIAKHILQHHERFDGSGYPEGLKGDEISREARIITLADAYDAMTSNRTYGTTLTKEEAILEIEKNMSTQFDPDIAQVFIKLLRASTP